MERTYDVFLQGNTTNINIVLRNISSGDFVSVVNRLGLTMSVLDPQFSHPLSLHACLELLMGLSGMDVSIFESLGIDIGVLSSVSESFNLIIVPSPNYLDLTASVSLDTVALRLLKDLDKTMLLSKDRAQVEELDYVTSK